jgi:selenocysteine lyase/cysteine desulfurase
MPIWLRLFTFNKMKEYYKNQNAQAEEAEESWTNKSGEAATAAKAQIPNFVKTAAKRPVSYTPTSTKK